jgi:ABC-2 type transport system permease protein
MTGQAESLPGARRRKRKNLRANGPEAPQQRQAKAADVEPAQVGPRYRAGWRIIAGKEFADFTTGWRFAIPTIVLALAGAAAVWTTAGALKNVASDASGNASLFLLLFAPGQAVNNIPPFTSFITFLGPLLGIAFGFDAINGERSDATLPRLLAQPIFRDDVINGKFVAGLSAIALILAAVIGVVAAIGVFQLGIFPSAQDVLRLMLWFILTIAYIGFWLALALLCSVLFRRAAASAITALGIWLVLTIFFSLIVGFVANFLSPVSLTSVASSSDTVANTEMRVNLSRLSPNELYTESTSVVLNPRLRTVTPDLVTQGQADQAIPGLLSLDQSLLVIWPQFVAMIAATMVAFGVAYVAFMRQEVRA